MTTPYERSRAVVELGKAVERLRPLAYKGDGAGKVLVEQSELQTLVLWLRHYPLPSELAATAEHCPLLWADPGRES